MACPQNFNFFGLPNGCPIHNLKSVIQEWFNLTSYLTKETETVYNTLWKHKLGIKEDKNKNSPKNIILKSWSVVNYFWIIKNKIARNHVYLTKMISQQWKWTCFVWS